MLRYPIKLEKDTNDTLLVTFPDIPEAVTFGDTREEALTNATDALENMIMAKMDDKEVIPMPSKVAGSDYITLSALSTAKIFIYNAMIENKINRWEFAKRIGCHPPQIERLLDLNHASRLDQIEKALNVLGLRLVMEFRKAA